VPKEVPEFQPVPVSGFETPPLDSADSARV